MRALGAAALDICAVGAGRLDGYVDFSVSAHGPWDYLGAMLSEGYPRSVPPLRARVFHAAGGPPLVGVLVNPSVEDAVARAHASGAAVLQLHGEEATATCRGNARYVPKIGSREPRICGRS